MHRVILCLLVGLLLVAGGCGPRAEDLPSGSAEKRILGAEDPLRRFRETSAEDMERERAKPRNGLALTIRTDKTEYQLGERIVLEVKLTNVTGGRSGLKPRDIPVYFEVFAKDAPGHRRFWLLKPVLRSEETGRVIFRDPDFEVPPEKRRDLYHFVVLPPKAFVGRALAFPSGLLDLQPGQEYSFMVTYMVDEEFSLVILNRHFTPEQVEMLGIKLAYARIWTGRLYSNRVHFRIRRKRRFLGLF